jgi:hypothetical protein
VGPVYDPNSFTPQALGPINATSAEAGEKLRPKSTLVLVLFNGKVPSPTIRIGDSFPARDFQWPTTAKCQPPSIPYRPG